MTDTIWWTDFCGNRSLYDAFWSPALSLETYNPDLTLCMQRSLLLWIPAGFLLFSAPIYIYILCQQKTVHKLLDFSKFNLLKMIVSALMTAISIASFTITCVKLTNQEPVPPVDITYGIIRIITMALVTVLTRLEYMKGEHTSSVLCPFWALYTLLHLIPFRSSIVRHGGQGPWAETDADFALDVTFFVLLLVGLLCSFFADPAALRPADKTKYTEEKLPLLLNSTSMQDTREDRNPSPDLSSSFWMKATFYWLLPDFLRNYRKTVRFEDLYDIRPQDSCGTVVPAFNAYFTRYFTPGRSGRLGSVRWALYRALFQTTGWPVVISLIIKTVPTTIFLVNPQLLRMLIGLIDSRDPYMWKVVVLALVMALGSFVASIMRHSVFNASVNASLRARNVVNAIVCRKALSLGGAAKRDTTVGEMINLLSVDGQKVQDGITWLQAVLDIPLVTLVTCILIWDAIGPASIAGIAILVIIVPLNGFYFGDKIRQFQVKQMIHKDSRLRILNEILNGIKILKLYAWENSFMKQTMTDRDGELRYIKRSNLVNAMSNSIWFIIPYLTSLAVFSVYVMTTPNHSLSADSAFVTLAYINTIQMPLAFLPLAVSNTGQLLVSMNRIAAFLELGELPKSTVVPDTTIKEAVQIHEASFSWDSDDGRAVLKQISLSVLPGELVAVVGQVGAGKSSLLSAILGELVRLQGHVKVNGQFAYVPQQAWILNSTLKDNILFDKPFSKKKYKKILDACSLTRDLEVLPGGDYTEIGEKGINLSGGQKARASLARAVYQDEDIYLLDDPLSAVDAHVGKHIFDKVIGKKGILKNKARILVTHAITFLPYVDKIVVLKDGCVSEIGQYDELLENDGAFAEYLRTYLVECDLDDEMSSASDILELQHRLSTLSGTESEGDLLWNHATSIRQRKGAVPRNNQLVQTSVKLDSKSATAPSNARLIEEEISQEGQMSSRVIRAYIKAGGVPIFIVVVVSLILFATAQVLTNIWLSGWTNDVPDVNGSISLDHASYRLGVYGGLGIFQVLTSVAVMVSVGLGCTHASYTLHQTLLMRVLRAPMSFFDTTPLGRIMNRFSRDMDAVDVNVPMFLAVWILSAGPAVCIVCLISYTTPIFLVVLAIIIVPYITIMRLFILYAAQLKRIESVCKSPLYAHFEETVTGASSIRAYRREEAFIAKAEHLINNSHRPWFQLNASQRLVGVTMETIAAVIIFCAALFAGLQRDQVGSGLAGMSVSYALQLTYVMNTVIRACQELETYMISVERIDEYTRVPSEAVWTLPSDSSSQLTDWPQEGALNFKGYGTRYRPGLDLVLSGVNLNIPPGEKVGVVGRTGAGKSSLTLALFRIIEAAEGKITIDGEDISKLGLHKLRSRLTVIPQDPVMFSGSLRMNLDPAQDYTDSDIWEALEHAHLKSFVQGLDEGLDYDCGEGGDAVSIGQRQLVCLARALLRKSKVLILDEATAAVDLETDALIQASIKTYFNQCTVITVAHRLNTVLDYDKILVLEQGKVKEFDSPENLLSDKSSVFYSLAKEAGLA